MPHLIDTRLIPGRRTQVAWWCPNGHRNSGGDRFCATCEHSLVERHAQIHASERAVVYRNPATGEIRRPPRADMPMPEAYVQQGFVREEIMSMIAHERETGSIHEQSNFSPGNEVIPTEPPPPRAPKEVIDNLVNEVRAAIQSGPFTMEQPLAEAPDAE